MTIHNMPQVLFIEADFVRKDALGGPNGFHDGLFLLRSE
jgi:hypothetical protein